MTLVVYVGGARSGKSRLAVERAQSQGGRVTFVATGEAGDDEMADRIARHRAERPAGWTTVEEPLDVGAAVASVPTGETVVVDCLSLWVANGGDGDVVAARPGLTIAVTNEVGLGIVPDNAVARGFRDDLGRVNAAWVAAADEAYFVVAGRTLRLS
ncbi:MAG TPA: bifunctional adenosylcobinamide kinase/adenosylcobinamide-phosphate guanylyltransferase [Gaiellaceae bacterium]|nr:bifunctional adenosylcobinamide kinase/adenosylcobinamide-phosphate guanylyltransferase [Gaiellaceae bacterium]